jgi:flagellar hook-associated protein 1 FlgK
LSELGELVRFALNAAHNDASAVPPANQLTGTREDLAAWNSSTRTGTAYIAVVNRATGATVGTAAIDSTVAAVSDVVNQINAGLAGLATASVNADGALEISAIDPANGLAMAEGDSAIHEVDSAGRDRIFGFSHFFGLNDLIVEGATGFELRSDIAADSSRIASAHLDVSMGPPPVATLGGVGDNRGAQALADALDRAVAVAARGGLSSRSSTATSYLADLVADAAQQTATAQDDVATRQTLVDSLSDRVGAISGVNVDEELARLVTYQQAYAVSARIIQITDQLFEQLLELKQ